MLRKLLAPSPLRNQTLTLAPSSPITSRPLSSRSKKHSPPPPPDDPYDPPFSPVPKSGELEDVPSRSDLPFDFRYSYSETDPSVRPIGFREPPRFSPFGPGRLDRKWDGVSAPASGGGMDPERAIQERSEVLGEPLTEEEVEEIVEQYRHSDCSRQINLGKGGVTHNMLDDIHNHWRRAEAVRIKCLGVPTLDMDNVCFHLEFFCRINLGEESSIARSTFFSCTEVETMILSKGQLYL